MSTSSRAVHVAAARLAVLLALVGGASPREATRTCRPTASACASVRMRPRRPRTASRCAAASSAPTRRANRTLRIAPRTDPNNPDDDAVAIASYHDCTCSCCRRARARATAWWTSASPPDRRTSAPRSGAPPSFTVARTRAPITRTGPNASSPPTTIAPARAATRTPAPSCPTTCSGRVLAIDAPPTRVARSSSRAPTGVRTRASTPWWPPTPGSIRRRRPQVLAPRRSFSIDAKSTEMPTYGAALLSIFIIGLVGTLVGIFVYRRIQAERGFKWVQYDFGSDQPKDRARWRCRGTRSPAEAARPRPRPRDLTRSEESEEEERETRPRAAKRRRGEIRHSDAITRDERGVTLRSTRQTRPTRRARVVDHQTEVSLRRRGLVRLRLGSRRREFRRELLGEPRRHPPILHHGVVLPPQVHPRGRSRLDRANHRVPRRVFPSDPLRDVHTVPQETQDVRSEGVGDDVSEPFSEDPVSRQRRIRLRRRARAPVDRGDSTDSRASTARSIAPRVSAPRPSRCRTRAARGRCPPRVRTDPVEASGIEASRPRWFPPRTRNLVPSELARHPRVGLARLAFHVHTNHLHRRVPAEFFPRREVRVRADRLVEIRRCRIRDPPIARVDRASRAPCATRHARLTPPIAPASRTPPPACTYPAGTP